MENKRPRGTHHDLHATSSGTAKRSRPLAAKVSVLADGDTVRENSQTSAGQRGVSHAKAHKASTDGNATSTAALLASLSDQERTIAQVSEKLSLPTNGVRAAVVLMDEGNTVPFIARYRKEATGCLDDAQLRDVAAQVASLNALEARRKTIIQALSDQGVFKGKLQEAVMGAASSKQLEDLYIPHRPKRSTRSTAAQDKGLAPLARLLLAPNSGLPPLVLAKTFVSKDVKSPADALAGARDILAEQACELPEVRDAARQALHGYGRMKVKAKASAVSSKKGKDNGPQGGGGGKGKGNNKPSGQYELYYGFERPVKHLQPHQTLAINRGESEGELSVSLEWDTVRICAVAVRALLETAAEARQGRPVPRTHRDEADAAVKDGVARLLRPAMEREMRAELTSAAQAHAVREFGRNLKSLLLQPPMPGQTVLGLDPGFRTGCKAAVVDATGRLLDTGVVYPHPPAPDAKRSAAAAEVLGLLRRHSASVVAIGNGTASAETERFVAKVCEGLAEAGSSGVGWVVVNEAGASIYSASESAGKELPGIDVTLRGAVSIARRLQDPLSELVKIEPQHIGVGLYQHDLKEKKLAQELDGVVEAAVNSVGVDVNVASPALLARVAGLGPSLASKMVEHRDLNGPFATRASLLQVKGVGKRVYEQCAGFLRVRDGPCALDNTPIHPESYRVVGKLAKQFLGLQQRKEESMTGSDLAELGRKVPDSFAEVSVPRGLGIGEHTLRDIIQGLRFPEQDLRGPPEKGHVRTSLRTLECLKRGDKLQGTIRNVVDFGAFVDVGIGKDVLLHKTEMAEGHVRDPHSIVAVGDSVKLRVIDIDHNRGRVGVSMLEKR